MTRAALVCLMLLGFTPLHALSILGNVDDWRLTAVDIDTDGMVRNTGHDGYIIFPEFDLLLADVRGIEFELEFDNPPAKPILLELFWRNADSSFSEDRKALFVLGTRADKQLYHFVVPLNSMYSFNGNLEQAGYQGNLHQIRFDLPSTTRVAMKINKADMLLNNLPDDIAHVEPFESLEALEMLNLDIGINQLNRSLGYGWNRLLADPGFLIFWFLLFIAVLFAIRKTTRDL